MTRDEQSIILRQIYVFAHDFHQASSDHVSELQKLAEELWETRKAVVNKATKVKLGQKEVENIAASLSTALTAASAVAMEDRSLDSLYFRTFNARRTKIATAH